MNNFTNNSAKFTEHFTEQFTQQRGLHCVWVPMHNDGKAPLISIWVDPTMAPFDARQQSGELAGITEATTSEEIENHLPCIAGSRRYESRLGFALVAPAPCRLSLNLRP
jgi:hypothetical protein